MSIQTWRKVYWLLIGLLAPEVLIYTAWSQRAEAKRFVDFYNRKIASEPMDLDTGVVQRCVQFLQHIVLSNVGDIFLGLCWQTFMPHR